MTTDAQTNLIEALKNKGFRASIAEPDVFLQGGMVNYLALRMSKGGYATHAPVATEAIEDIPTDVLADLLACSFEESRQRAS